MTAAYSDLFLGAYAMAPEDPSLEEAFYAGVVDLGVRGLELPLPLEGASSLEPTWLARNLRSSWDLLVTCIPTVMGRLASEAGYGLASADEGARARALDDVARARDLALRLAHAAGRRRVVAIQVHGAPGAVGGSRDAFSRSLEEVLTWDLAGAEILVEHCDARLPGQIPAKGFWSVEDDIAAVLSVGATDAELGLSVNWGRSAIEGRSPQAAVAHVEQAVKAGVLRAVVFSGASAAASPWGQAWGDSHMPPRGDGAALHASSYSLLGSEEMASTLRAAGQIPYVGVKISVRPEDAEVATRLAVAAAALAQVQNVRNDIAVDMTL